MNLYDNVSLEKKNRLQQTFEQFGVKNINLIGETLLRLENYIENRNSCPLPKDQTGKALFNMFKYYQLVTPV